MEIGDKIKIPGKEPRAIGLVKSFEVTGDQLHGEEIQRVKIEILEPGHGYKRKTNYVFDLEDLK